MLGVNLQRDLITCSAGLISGGIHCSSDARPSGSKFGNGPFPRNYALAMHRFRQRFIADDRPSNSR